MTPQQKDEIIERMLACPDSLSDWEIEQIVDDDELREIYAIAVEVKAAMAQPTEIDTTAEWQLFKPMLQRTLPWWRTSWARAAAVALVLAAVASLFFHRREPLDPTPLVAELQPEVEIVVPGPAHYDTIPTPATAPQPVPRLAKAKVPQSAEAAEEVAEDFDMEEYLRVQEARVDNALAMQRAEELLCQYYACIVAGTTPSAQLYGDGASLDNDIMTLVIQ